MVEEYETIIISFFLSLFEMDKMSLAYCGCDEIEEFPLQDRSTRKAALCIPREALSTRQLKLVRSHEGSWVQSLDVRLRSWVSSPVVSS